MTYLELVSSSGITTWLPTVEDAVLIATCLLLAVIATIVAGALLSVPRRDGSASRRGR